MTIQFVIACGLTALEGYLLGSLLFGLVISKLFYHDDVRLHGSGNAGMTNVRRTYGKLPALLTTVGDVGKSFVAVHLGQLIFSSLMGAEPLVDPICGAYLAAIFCVIGHSRPVFFGFRRGLFANTTAKHFGKIRIRQALYKATNRGRAGKGDNGAGFHQFLYLVGIGSLINSIIARDIRKGNVLFRKQPWKGVTAFAGTAQQHRAFHV